MHGWSGCNGFCGLQHGQRHARANRNKPIHGRTSLKVCLSKRNLSQSRMKGSGAMGSTHARGEHARRHS
eukprot:scaffold287_cov337-Pavlova_lutheri.AAC.69